MAIRDRDQAVINLVINGEQAKTSLTQITGALNGVRSARARMNQEENPARYQELIRQERALAAALQARRREVEQGAQSSKGFFGIFKSGFAEIQRMAAGVTLGNLMSKGITMAVDGLKTLISSGIEAYKTFQKFDTILTNALGDRSASKKAMNDLQKFAADTPYGMEELTNSFIKLVNRGVNPTNDELRKMGDLASSQGKSFDQLTEAVLDAMTGENERLKEFGIRAQKDGDKVRFTFKGITKEVENNEEAIKNAILSFGDMDGVAGGMEKLSKTLEGVESNMEDNYQRVLTKIGRSAGGILYSVMSTASDILSVMAETRTESEKLTDEFAAQTQKVNGLEKNIAPLITRYEELKSKGQLNKIEQNELKNVIGQIADIIPSAVTQWDKYGNALGINTEKARDFIRVQKQLLQYQNKEAIEATKEELQKLIEQRDTTLRILNKGKTTDIVSSMGAVPVSTEIKRDLTDKERLALRDKLKELNVSIGDVDARLRGLNGAFLDSVEKKTVKTAAVVKKINEMTGDELNKHIKDLQDSLGKYVVGSAKYKQISQEIADAQKLLNYEKNAPGLNKKAENAADKYARELEGIRSEYLKLAEAAKKGTVEDLDAQLAVIDDKYRKIVAKLRGLLKDTHVTPEVKKELLADIDNIEKKGGLRDQEVAGKTSDFSQKQADKAEKQDDAEVKAGTERLDNVFGTASAELSTQENDALLAVTGSSPEEVEASRLNIKELYAQKAYELEQGHLNSLIELYQAYGKSTGAIDSKIAANTIKENERAAAKKLADTKRYNDAKKEIQNLELDAAENGAKTLQTILGKNTLAYKAALVVEQAIAAARVVIATETAIATYAATVAALGPLGVPLLAAYTVAARISEGISLAAIAAQTIVGLKGDSGKKAAKGGMITAGPSHAEGGMDLYNHNTGEHIVNMEGNEAIIFSADTYRNNKEIIDELLFNSMYRNGATVDLPAVSQGIQYARNGGAFSSGSQSPAPAESPGQATDVAEQEYSEALLLEVKGLNEKFDDFRKKPWSFPMRAFLEEMERIDAFNQKGTL